jgi:hypothetical protein
VRPLRTNAFLALPGALAPTWDLVGPTVEDDLRRLVTRYGAAAVKEATKRVIRAKRGPKTIPDWRELEDVIEADARLWLAGDDPMKQQTNYAIAKKFAERNPGQSAVSTHQRVERKLGQKPFGRFYHIMVKAEALSRSDFTWSHNVRALEALASLQTHRVWDGLLRSACNDISDYTAKWGPPAPDLTMSQVEEGARLSLPSGSAFRNLTGQSSGLGGILAQAVADALP